MQSATGTTPQPAAAGTAVNLYRAYTSLALWESQDENDTLEDAVENFDVARTLVATDTIMHVAAYADGPDTGTSLRSSTDCMELSQSAEIPTERARSTWSVMSEIRGLITSVTPRRRAAGSI